MPMTNTPIRCDPMPANLIYLRSPRRPGTPGISRLLGVRKSLGFLQMRMGLELLEFLGS